MGTTERQVGMQFQINGSLCAEIKNNPAAEKPVSAGTNEEILKNSKDKCKEIY